MKSYTYEAPLIRDLEELGLKGQFPLSVDTCTPVGLDDGADDTCLSGCGETCQEGSTVPQ
jgi:hypothetical protein